MEKLAVSDEHSGVESKSIDVEIVKDVASGELKDDETNEVGEAAAGDAAAISPSKKKRKPKKKAKKLVAPPTVTAVEHSLPWSLASSARLGRHAVAKRDIKAGELVLVEAPVAAVVRSQFAKNVCHSCFRDIPSLGPPAPPQDPPGPFKRYCSRACAQADACASLTQNIDAQINDIAVKTQTNPDLLRLILELDSRRAMSAPPVKQRMLPDGAWILEAGKPAAAGEMGGRKSKETASSPGKDGTASHGHKDAAANEAGKEHAETHTNGNGNSSKRPEERKPGQQAVAPSATVRCRLADVETLASHWDRSSEGWRKSVRAGCQALRQAMIADGAYQPGSLQQLLDLASIINSNSHGVGAANSSNTDRGVGLYPALSMLNHSCHPNCAFASNGSAMQVRVVRPVTAGEQLTVTYINLMEPRHIRARQLMDTKHFACACDRCTQPLEASPDRFLEAVKCTASGCEGGWLLEQRADNLSEGGTWRCTACTACVAAHNVDGRSGPLDITEAFAHMWHQAKRTVHYKGHAAGRPAFEALLARAEGALHPMHVSAFDSLMPLVNCCRAAGDTVSAIRHLTRMLDTMDAVCGLPTVEVGNLHDLLGELHADRASSAPAALRARAKKQARDAWARALSVLSICLGEQHEKCVDLSMRIRLLR